MPPTIIRKRTFAECLERGLDDPVAFAQDFLDIKPHPGQETWLRTRNDAKERMLHCSNRWGKDLHVDTPIPTTTGWSTMGEMKIGDRVFGADGVPCSVVGVSEVFTDHKCFDVHFSDGSVITAGEGHEWLTWTYAARRGEENHKRRGWKAKHQPSIVTTREIFETQTILGERANHSVQVTKPLDLPEAALTIAPYVLGAWLGDGASRWETIACHPKDIEVIEQVRAEGYCTRKYASKAGKCGVHAFRAVNTDFSTDSMIGTLRSLNLLQNKHIPQAYLRGSYQQRLDLLQGLIDTDGNVEKDTGQVEFCTTKECLADGVVELACSLGLKPTVYRGRAMLYGKDCGPKFRVVFTTNLPVCRLPRKLARLKKSLNPTTSRRYITKVVERETVPTRCIEVDSSDHLYLVGKTFIPTHNSHVAGIKLLHRAFYQIRDQRFAYDTGGRPKPYTAISIAMSMDQARLAWDYALQLGSNSPRFSKFIVGTDHSPFPCLYISNTGKGTERIISEIWARSTAKRAKYLLGKHFAFVNYDEAAFDTDGEVVWNDVVRMRLADENGDIDFTSTPNLKNWFFAQCERGRLKGEHLPPMLADSYVDPRCYTQTGVLFDNPHVDQEFVRKAMVYMTEVQRAQNVYGQFADASSVFGIGHIEQCYRDQDYRDLMGADGLPADYEVTYVDKDSGRLAKVRKSSTVGEYVVGADLARKRDKTVIIVLRVDGMTKGEPAQMVMYKAFSRTSWRTVYEEIQRASFKYHNAPVLIDSTGVGDNVLSALQEEPYNLSVSGYNFAGTGKEKQNLVINLQSALQNRLIVFPFIRELYDQLAYYEWDDRKLETDSVFALALAWQCHLNQTSKSLFDPGSLDILIATSGYDRLGGRRIVNFDQEPKPERSEEELQRLRREWEEDRIRRYAQGEDLEEFDDAPNDSHRLFFF